MEVWKPKMHTDGEASAKFKKMKVNNPPAEDEDEEEKQKEKETKKD